MAYRYRSRRSARRLARKSKRNFIITLFLIGFLIYATIQWILPTLITGLGFVTNIVKPSQKQPQELSENASLAPPVLNIPYEATNTAQINIRGYGTPHSKVSIFIEDSKKDTTQISDDGTFEIKDITLSLGTNNIYGKSIDEKNLESLPSKTIRIIYDNEKPPLEVSEPEDGKTIQGDKIVKIAGKTEPNAKVMINETLAVIDKDGNFQNIFSLNDGDNNFTIIAQDLAGNFTEIVRRVIFQP